MCTPVSSAQCVLPSLSAALTPPHTKCADLRAIIIVITACVS